MTYVYINISECVSVYERTVLEGNDNLRTKIIHCSNNFRIRLSNFVIISRDDLDQA